MLEASRQRHGKSEIRGKKGQLFAKEKRWQAGDELWGIIIDLRWERDARTDAWYMNAVVNAIEKRPTPHPWEKIP